MELSDLGLDDYEVMEDAGLIVGRKGHIAVVLLDRPDRGNAFHTPMKQALGPLWLRLDDDPDVRAIVFGATSERFFCTGRDITEVNEKGSVGVDRSMYRSFNLTTRHSHVWKPVVCAVEGLVVGGGLHFIVDADIVVAGEGAMIRDSHVNLGYVGAIENIGLALKAGIGNALYLTLVGREAKMPAERAYQLGLYQELVPDGQALSRSLELAELIAKNSPSAVSRSLEAVWSLPYVAGYEQSLSFGHQLLRRQWQHPDSKEGARAWGEKRDPMWST